MRDVETTFGVNKGQGPLENRDQTFTGENNMKD